MRDDIDRSRTPERPATPLAAAARPDRAAQHPQGEEKKAAAIDWSGRLDGLLVAAVELSRWSAEGRLAAERTRVLPEVAGALPIGPEAARVGQSARLVGATLATIRAARAASGMGPALRAQAFGERMSLRWAALDGLLGQVRAGDAGLGPAIDATIAAALTDAQTFFEASARGPGGLERAGVKPLFGAADEVGRALDEAGRELLRPEAKESSAAPIESLLRQAAAAAGASAEAAAEVPALPIQTTARALDPEGKPPPDPDRDRSLTSAKKERPATWELRVEATTAEVGVQEIARALGVARLADVREVLLQGLSTRHQFVLWTRVGIRLSTALQALVNDGLVETRIQPR
jgi:hypothetical protein